MLFECILVFILFKLKQKKLPNISRIWVVEMLLCFEVQHRLILTNHCLHYHHCHFRKLLHIPINVFYVACVVMLKLSINLK